MQNNLNYVAEFVLRNSWRKKFVPLNLSPTLCNDEVKKAAWDRFVIVNVRDWELKRIYVEVLM